MLTEDEVFHAIQEYAHKYYGYLFDSLWESFDHDNQVGDLFLGQLYNDFICYLIYEVPYARGGNTIAEEFARVSNEINSEMEKKIKEIRKMVKSQFRIKSVKGHYVEVEDTESGKGYRVIKMEEGPSLSESSVIKGRIHPFGDHYRFIGGIHILAPSMENGMDLLVKSIFGGFKKDLEMMHFRPNTSFITIMKKYPANWVDRISETYGIDKRKKDDKIASILEIITEDTNSLIDGLSPEAKEVLGICMNRGGYSRMIFLKDFDDDTTYFQEKKSRTPIVELRQKGLLFFGLMSIDRRDRKVAFVPREVRDSLEPHFNVKQRGMNRTLDDIFSEDRQ